MAIFTRSIILCVALFIFTSDLVNAKPYRRQCTGTLTTATNVANRLQSEYYDSLSGEYDNGALWSDANALEDLHNLMLADGSDDFGDVADNSYIGSSALDSDTDWNSFLGGSNDDAQWVILALWKVADYKSARGQDSSAYLSSAQKIYDIIAGQWDETNCGGGVWWSTDKTYKNAITNELFLYTSARGYLRFQNQTYLDYANKEWTWLNQSGMRGSDGMYNDGQVLDTCQNNGQTLWTYNQGVIASGLGALGVANGDTSLFDQAEITLDATISGLTDNGVLKESCDDPTSSGCNNDQQIFKGIWTKHLQYYLDITNDAARTAKYSSFLGDQYTAITQNAVNSDEDVSSLWYAPDQGGALHSAQASTSGLAAIVSNAKYGPC